MFRARLFLIAVSVIIQFTIGIALAPPSSAQDWEFQVKPRGTLKKDLAALTGWFNERKTGSKWKDVRLRQALNYAINREELKKYAAKGNAYALGDFLCPGAFGHNPNMQLYTYDTDRARALLAEAGYPDGFAVKILTYDACRLECQIISRMLERIGLAVTTEVLTRPQLWRKIHIPSLGRPPEEQDWDIMIAHNTDRYGHPGGNFVACPFNEETDLRWAEYDPEYETIHLLGNGTIPGPFCTLVA